MIAPQENEAVRFASPGDELDFLRACGLVSAKAVKSKAFYYSGRYSRWPVFCRVVGKTVSGDAIIALPGGEHCIDPDCLSEMQSGSAQLYKDVCEINGISSFVGFDVETTGLSSQNDRIIEIGAVKYDGGKEIDRFQSLVDPRMDISPFITSLTGITNDALRTAPRLEEILPEFMRFLGGLPVVAHNAPFDKGFLESACTRLGLELKNSFYDTLRLSRRIFPGLPSYKLQDLTELLSLDGGTAHRALFDACTAAQLFELCRTEPFASNNGMRFQ